VASLRWTRLGAQEATHVTAGPLLMAPPKLLPLLLLLLLLLVNRHRERAG
jgi:hypothetical protein